MKIRRIISMMMALIMLYSLVIPSFAVSLDTANVNKQDGFSVVDADGKVNTYHVYSSEAGTSHVDYYVDGELIESIDTTIVSSSEVTTNTVTPLSRVHIVYTNAKSGEVNEYTELLSKYISSNDSVSINTEATRATNETYTLQGKINYNTHYDEISGIQINDKLFIYQTAGNQTYEYKTVNATAGQLVSYVINIIGAALSLIHPELASLAAELLYAAASAVGVSIVSNEIQGNISKQYYVKTTKYNVKAYDLSSSRQRIYSAEAYNVALNGGGYSSQTYYEGYLPWRSNTVAYNMFCDFWTYPYPGVSSYE